MLPIRQRAACMARRACVRPAAAAAATPAARRLASTGSHGDHGHHDHHDHHGESHAAADEPIGAAFFIGLGAIPLVYAVYALSRPGADGAPTALEAYLGKFAYLRDQWETRNSLHTAAVEQAAQDKNLLYTVDRNTHVELRYPETFQSGSPYNVPAGHHVNLDKVVEHYRAQYQQETERQAKAAAARAKE